MLYLAAPLVLFFLGFFRLPLGALLLVALAAALAPWLRSAGDEGRRLSGPAALAALVVALAWTALGGAGHLVFANEDWLTRDAVLRDLTLSGWPPAYGLSGGAPAVLRCPVAYYLPAAALAKVLGLGSADLLLYLWTALGVALFLAIAVSETRGARAMVVGLAVVVLFSGMDVVGARLLGGPGGRLTDHLEWWALRFQYPAATTLLFWAPNHALSGWIVGALLYRRRRRAELPLLAPAAIAIMPLWSPLPMLGIAPFLLLLAVRHLRLGRVRWGALAAAALPAAIVFLAVAAYLTLDSGQIPAGSAIRFAGSFGRFAVPYALFVPLEFGVAALVLWRLRPDPMVATAAATLVLLPFFVYGPLNDIVMRGSIPALTVLCLAAVDALALESWRGPERAVRLALAFVLAIGSVTAVHEIARALLFPAWAPLLEKNLVQVQHQLPPHYVARLNRPYLAKALRPPAPVPWGLPKRPGETR